MNSLDTFFARLEQAGGVRLGVEVEGDSDDRRRTLADVRRDYPFIVRGDHAEPLWLEFLERYGGATVELGRHQVVLLGLDDRLAPHLLEAEGPLIDPDGFMDFAVVSLERSAGAPKERYLDIGYCFDATGRRRSGVYQRVGDQPVRWFAPSFEGWLERVAAAAGDLEALAGGEP